MAATSKLLQGRFSKTPCLLYRIQNTLPVKLRDYSPNKPSFDLTTTLKGKEKIALDPKNPLFTGPNGMSWRPPDINLYDILCGWKGPVTLYALPKDVELPKELVMIHELGDHFSLQTTEDVSLKCVMLNERLTHFLRGLETVTKEQYFKLHPLR